MLGGLKYSGIKFKSVKNEFSKFSFYLENKIETY